MDAWLVEHPQSGRIIPQRARQPLPRVFRHDTHLDEAMPAEVQPAGTTTPATAMEAATSSNQATAKAAIDLALLLPESDLQ
jgi:hypothetical protein